MTDANTVQSGLATLGVNGWTVNDIFGSELGQGYITLIGDSITNRNIQENTGSLLQYFSSDGFFAWTQIMLQGQLMIAADLGVSGETATQIRSRINTVFSYNTEWVGLLAGTNDITGGATEAAIIADLKAMYRAVLSRGRKLFIATIMPRGAINTGAMRQVLSGVNQFIRDFAANESNVACADFYASWADPSTGDPISGVSDDSPTLHPNPMGAMLLGRAGYEALKPFFPAVSGMMQGVNLDPYNLAYNGMTDGNNASGANGYVNAAGFTGQGPNGWTNIRTGTATGVCSKVNRTNWQQGTLARCAAAVVANFEETGFNIRTDVTTWSAAASKTRGQSYCVPTVDNGYWYVAESTGATGGAEPTWPTQLGDTVVDNAVTWRCVDKISPGDTVYAQAYIETSSLVGNGLIDLNLKLLDNGFAVLWQTHALRSTGSTALPNWAPASGVYRTLEVVVPDTFTIAASGPTIRFSLRPKFVGLAGASINLDVSNVEIKKKRSRVRP